MLVDYQGMDADFFWCGPDAENIDADIFQVDFDAFEYRLPYISLKSASLYMAADVFLIGPDALSMEAGAFLVQVHSAKPDAAPFQSSAEGLGVYDQTIYS